MAPHEFIEIYSTSRDLAARLPERFKFHKLKNLKELETNTFAHTYSLLLLDERTPVVELIEFLMNAPPQEMARLGVIYCAQEFSEKDVLALSSQPQVLKMLNREKTADLESEIKKAMATFIHQRETEDLMGRVRAQNKVLNELNDNLEQIIQQRTEHLETSKKEIELKLRDVRELIKFIKSLSNVEGFEDLILILKHEFLKYHKVRSPMLIYSLSNDAYRCVYFQGQQIGRASCRERV